MILHFKYIIFYQVWILAVNQSHKWCFLNLTENIDFIGKSVYKMKI